MSQLLFAIVVVLSYPRTVSGLIAFAELVVKKMTGNTYFPAPPPALAAVTDAITAYQTAISSQTKGLKGLRAAKKAALLKLLKQIRDHVRTIAEADPENAVAIVESAGLSVKRRPVLIKALIRVLQGAVSGSVVCIAKSVGDRANYYWFYSLDEKSWIAVPESMTTKVTVSGLTPGQTYYFRYRTMTRKGTSDFSQVVSLLVK